MIIEFKPCNKIPVLFPCQFMETDGNQSDQFFFKYWYQNHILFQNKPQQSQIT